MVKLVRFLKKIYVFLLFIVLEAVALNFYAHSTSYTKARLLTASNYVAGHLHGGLSAVGDYFGLRSENDLLLEEIAELRNLLGGYEASEETGSAEISPGNSKYIYTVASVINNSITRQENYIVIDKGYEDGIRPDMALVTSDMNIVGYVLDCSRHFSVAMSVLNINFNTGGIIKGKDNFGSVLWNGTDHRHVTLSEVDKYARIEKGDTVVTGISFRFPTDVGIGTVEDFELQQSGFYSVKVKLFSPMATLKKLLVVNYVDMDERMTLEEQYF